MTSSFHDTQKIIHRILAIGAVMKKEVSDVVVVVKTDAGGVVWSVIKIEFQK